MGDELLLATMIIATFAGFMATFLIIYFMKMDTIVRAKLKHTLTKKPYGVAYFHIGEQIFPRVINFEKDTIRTKYAIYAINDAVVGIQKVIQPGKYDKEKQTYELDRFISVVQGVPTIHFDHKNFIPKVFGTYEEAKIPNAHQIQATLKKELELAEAEQMYHGRDKLRKLILAAMIVSFISIPIMLFTLMQVMDLASKLIPAA